MKLTGKETKRKEKEEEGLQKVIPSLASEG